MQRFFACCPQPIFFTAAEIADAPLLPYSIELVFLYIKIKHGRHEHQIGLSEDAKLRFEEYFTQFRELVKLGNHQSTFIR